MPQWHPRIISSALGPATCCSPMPCSAQMLHPEHLQSTTLGSSQEQHQLLHWKNPGSSSQAGFIQGRQWQAPHKHTGGQKKLKSKDDLRSVAAIGELLTGFLVNKLCKGQKLLPFFNNTSPKKHGREIRGGMYLIFLPPVWSLYCSLSSDPRV